MLDYRSAFVHRIPANDYYIGMAKTDGPFAESGSSIVCTNSTDMCNNADAIKLAWTGDSFCLKGKVSDTITMDDTPFTTDSRTEWCWAQNDDGKSHVGERTYGGLSQLDSVDIIMAPIPPEG